jgi:hypothetical protein
MVVLGAAAKYADRGIGPEPGALVVFHASVGYGIGLATIGDAGS